MNKIIALPSLLLVLNFNAQKDFITKYDLKTFVSNNYELIENINPKKIKDIIKLNKKLFQHTLKNNGIIANYLFKPRLRYEFKKTMSDNKNFIKNRNRAIISLVVFACGISTIAVWGDNDQFATVLAAIIILPPTLVIALIPQIGILKIRAQLLKDYLLSIGSANKN